MGSSLLWGCTAAFGMLLKKDNLSTKNCRIIKSVCILARVVAAPPPLYERGGAPMMALYKSKRSALAGRLPAVTAS